MNKKDLVAIVSNRTKLSKKETEYVITVILETIITALVQGDRVTLVGFGSFRVKTRKARRGRNPKTGHAVSIPAKKVPSFSVGKFFQYSVNNSQYL
nr:DNA binding histon like protein [Proteomonas sp. NEIS-1375]